MARLSVLQPAIARILKTTAGCIVKPIVLFKPIHQSKDTVRLAADFKQFIRQISWEKYFPRQYLIGIKLHFGEKNNTGHIPSPVIKVLADKLKSLKHKPFLTDTNVLYHGGRTNTVDHLILASQHGFSLEKSGVPVIIADGLTGEHVHEIPFSGKHCTTIKAAGIIRHLHGLVSVAHYTGHMLTGFGGTIKNIGMGLANRAGKQIQHSAIKPSVLPRSCTFCKQCIRICPVHAITESNKKAVIDQNTCIGCGDCIVACQFKAIDITWEESIPVTEEKMAEYATGIIRSIPHSYFINMAVRITKECDCMAGDDPSVVEDIGVLGSPDPVALDKATLDLVNAKAGKDIFKILHPESDYLRQLNYAAELGLGSLSYELKEIA
ncbi:MAG: DUF362 domain-containing protein [Elusimicrobia bacterium]|nr:DUF362 domain-containing protein [Elusimicrobiota bacterium]MBD3412500.1 DUF362 domain-containing protein [Elusimicrobiota bacterium]